jgi:hypothetical protein
LSIAQTTLNPEISVIPRFRLESDDGGELPVRRIFGRPQFSLEEFEIAIQGSLNPFARADVFLAKKGFGDEPIEIEEAYATFLRGLPLDLNFRIGKYLADFGKLNMVHPHAWSFVSQPLSLERFIGEEGINDLGISGSILLPAGDVLYSKLTVDVLRGNSISSIAPSSDERYGGPGLVDTVAASVYYANSARLMMFFPTSENGDLEIGFSGLTGIHDPYQKLRFYYSNVDFKYKWKPGAYTSLVLQGEALFNSRKILVGPDARGRRSFQTVTSGGFYVFADLQFNKVFTIGARYDWSQSPYTNSDKAEGGAVFIGYYPVEETAAFRLQFQHVRSTQSVAERRSINSIALQFVFALGPHKAHLF